MDNSKIIEKVLAAREAGHVCRSHTMPHLGEYTVGKHSYDALSLLFLLYPGGAPRLELAKAVLWHDGGERWVGDMPGPAKWYDPALGEAYERAEAKASEAHGFWQDITPEERSWLDGVDKLELYLWCHDQLALGNRNAESFLSQLKDWFRRNEPRLPSEVMNFYKSYYWRRLSEWKS